MRIGFTGTRKGLSIAQEDQLRLMLRMLWTRDAGMYWDGGDEHPENQNVNVVHHGGCRGADEDAAELAKEYAYEECVHEPFSQKAADLLRRNRDIVAACDILIAAPETDTEERRSGTWSTVRYARTKGIPVVMLSRGSR